MEFWYNSIFCPLEHFETVFLKLHALQIMFWILIVYIMGGSKDKIVGDKDPAATIIFALDKRILVTNCDNRAVEEIFDGIILDAE